MTREECENRILEKMNEIIDVYRQYNPYGKYLTLAYTEDMVTFNNEYWDKGCDCNIPINRAEYK